MESFSYYKGLKNSGFWAFLSICFLPILLIAIFSELSFDETYYWIYSQYLAFGYFDHPPMVGLMIKLGTMLFGHSEFGVRSFSLLMFLGTVAILRSLTNSNNFDKGFWFLLLVFPLLNLGGVFALPDSCLMFFSALYFYTIKKYLEQDDLKSMLMVGVSIACMFYSKYHGLLIVILTVAAIPTLFKRKSFYQVILVVLVLYFPHIYWQYQNDFVSFKFHLFGRAEKHFEVGNILDFLGGQFILMGGPLFFYSILKFKTFNKADMFTRVLLANSFGFLLFLFLLSFRNQIEANWSLSCAIAFFILISKLLEGRLVLLLKLSSVNILLNILIKLLLIFIPYFASLNIKDNRLNEIYGWKNIRIPEINKLCEGLTIIGDNYQVTSKVAFYNIKPEIPALHFGSRESHYSLLQLESGIPLDASICYLTSKNLENSVKIETGYKDPVYVLKNLSFLELINSFKI